MLEKFNSDSIIKIIQSKKVILINKRYAISTSQMIVTYYISYTFLYSSLLLLLYVSNESKSIKMLFTSILTCDAHSFALFSFLFIYPHANYHLLLFR